MQQSRFIFNPKYQPQTHEFVDDGEKKCTICGNKKDEHHEQYQTHPTYTGFGCAYCGRAEDEHLRGEAVCQS